MDTPRIMIIAGSDSGGGAGIQADIKTVTMLGGHAMTAITAITAQNTLGVQAVMPVPADMVIAQIDSVVSDIGVDAVKIGMIGSAETAHAVADRLEGLSVPIVFDPVMVATSGDVLADDGTIAAFARLMRIATVTTPNLPELRALSGMSIVDREAIRTAARSLADRRGCAILAKGGHARGPHVTDILFPARRGGEREMEWSDPRIDSNNTHGTGCTLASAIACGLASHWNLEEAITRARRFVRIAIHDATLMTDGHGPMAHQRVRQDVVLDQSAPLLNQITLPAGDFAASESFYARLGLRQIVRSAPRYARFESASGTTLSIEAADEIGGTPVFYFECGDLDEWVEMLTSIGVAFERGPADEDWGWREARLRDPAGNAICLYQAGENRRFPPWRLP
ncbi:bifunctional hydroxymethylpyrimidine kinase/phosphomethylpyrimidine kinase [Sphingomonas sp. AR_OL41]|uniref:bifunctional hydroxymethylpyrimidine kinase/phosphomethylpyrimidine kinase n=1 Tax=Sphingomonas sp. AR_OL41 TaxID=3042729 RepID=UPI00248097BA|nr:bifunctional hydroxymethylpyrimidine kinase/phosphomethylpyrimidine kinase [Sphingomonas sp. AR_OL41]MDH7975532.1 bifunctional hydroxymethylpyrimidine kinase/phosphomethylpyrimidine kinase [Sphingomonas sp. AR_OL41]